MGFKFLGLQIIPWCFHLNHLSCIHLRPDPTPQTTKLIKPDGLVKIYTRPIKASEVMIEYPKHLISHSDSFYIGQKVQALSEDDQLQLGHKYFLLPKQFFQSVLTFVTVASFASSSQSQSQSQSKNAFLKMAKNCQPFDIRKTPSGSLQIRVSDEFISKLMEEGTIVEEENENSSKLKLGKVCTTPELQKDYIQLVKSRQWKPKLETIKETRRRKLGSFGMKRRKKSSSKGIQKIQRSEQLHVACTPCPSKSKTKISKIKAKKEL